MVSWNTRKVHRCNYSIMTVPNISGLYSIAAAMFSCMLACLISSSIKRCASASKGSALKSRRRWRSRSLRALICSLRTSLNASRSPERTASASRGLFCLSSARDSGLARNMRLISAGSSSKFNSASSELLAFSKLLVAPSLWLVPGISMELKSKFLMASTSIVYRWIID